MLDVLGAAYLQRNLDVLAVEGRLVIIGMQGGRTAEIDLATLFAKRAALLATTLRSRPVEAKAAIVAAVGEHVWPLLQDGSVVPVIHARVHWQEVAEAHRLLDSGQVVGKVVLTVD